MQTNINSIMKSFQQFTKPSYEDVKLDLPRFESLNEASILKPDYVIGHSFIWQGTNKIISSIFEPYEKVTIVKPVGNPDAFYGDEDGEYEKFFKGQKSGKFLHIKSNSQAPLSSSWTHYKEDGSPPAGAQWEDLIVVEYNNINGKKSDKKVVETWQKFPMFHETARAIADKFNSKIKSNELVHTGAGGLKPTLGKIWQEEGASNTTPKTDIASKDFNERISLKKEGGSRLASPERKEAVAIVKAALKHCGQMDKNFGKELTAKMYSHMEKLSTTETVTSLNRRLKAGEEDSATKEFSKVDEQNKELSKYLEEIINHDRSVSGKFTKALVWEATTGAEKFGSKDDKSAANKIAKFDLSGNIEYHDVKSPNSKIIKTYSDKLKPYVSFKKGGGNSAAYSALQLALEQKEHKPITANRIFIEELEKEGLGSLMEESQVMLDEDILATLKKTASSIGSGMKKMTDKVVKAFKNALKRIKGFLSKIAKMGAEMFKKLLSFFNIEIERVTNVRGGVDFHLL